VDTIKFSCDVAVKDATDTPLTITALLNGEEKTSLNVVDSSILEFDIPNVEDANYKLELVLSGKTDKHTLLDDRNNVLSSTELLLTNFNFDEINIDSIVLTNSLPYTHNFNGASETVTEKFYDTAGCNGTITLEFTTPFYLWLLENM
jgi:hypothetical protein